MKKKQTIFMLGFLSGYFIICSGWAFQGVRGIALSNAIRGAVGLNEALYVNPAGFAFSGRYSVEGQSFYLPSQQGPAFWVLNGSVVDAHLRGLQAGLGFSRKIQVGRDQFENAYYLALSTIFKDIVSVGMTGKYFHQDLENAENQMLNLDIGTFWVLTSQLQMGMVGHNVLGPKTHLGETLKRELGIGFRGKLWDFLMGSVDISKNLDRSWKEDIAVHGGLEFVRQTGILTQMGLSLSDQKDQNRYSFGLGWAQHKFGVFYAFQNSMDSLRRMTQALSLRIFFQ
ncbi:MAG: hypothetical protein HY390_07125 [Deltaproteobacteria bacterium]|nr:hypothetical protein [Deltaproteobacteria bacterium]